MTLLSPFLSHSCSLLLSRSLSYPFVGICELIYAEEYSQYIPSSGIRCPVMHHKKQFEKKWLAGMEVARVSLHTGQLVAVA